MQGISWSGVVTRIVLALALVLLTFNPSGHSFYHWISAPPPGITAVKAFAAVALVIALQPRALAPLGPTESVVSPVAGMAMTDAAVDGTWGFVVGLASELKYADVKEAAQPVSGTADAVIDELTPAQRTALARLLEKEMGEQ